VGLASVNNIKHLVEGGSLSKNTIHDQTWKNGLPVAIWVAGIDTACYNY
jgi:hypothetical protein